MQPTTTPLPSTTQTTLQTITLRGSGFPRLIPRRHSSGGLGRREPPLFTPYWARSCQAERACPPLPPPTSHLRPSQPQRRKSTAQPRPQYENRQNPSVGRPRIKRATRLGSLVNDLCALAKPVLWSAPAWEPLRIRPCAAAGASAGPKRTSNGSASGRRRTLRPRGRENRPKRRPDTLARGSALRGVLWGQGRISMSSVRPRGLAWVTSVATIGHRRDSRPIVSSPERGLPGRPGPGHGCRPLAVQNAAGQRPGTLGDPGGTHPLGLDR
jgi:hypothetical protein